MPLNVWRSGAYRGHKGGIWIGLLGMSLIGTLLMYGLLRPDEAISSTWNPLSATEQSKLFVRLRDKPKMSVSLVCGSSECVDLAISFNMLFEKIDWSVTNVGSAKEIISQVDGILIQSKSGEAIQFKDAIEAATHMRAALRVADSTMDMTVIIGRLPKLER